MLNEFFTHPTLETNTLNQQAILTGQFTWSSPSKVQKPPVKPITERKRTNPMIEWNNSVNACTLSEKYRTLSTTTVFNGSKSIWIANAYTGICDNRSFSEFALPDDFLGISQVLCVKSCILIVEVGKGRLFKIKNAQEGEYVKEFDGVELRVLKVCGESVGVLLWVWSDKLQRSVLYGAELNYYGSLGNFIEVFDPIKDVESGDGIDRVITHLGCAVSCSFCVTNGVEIRVSGEGIWKEPSSWKNVKFTTRAHIVDLQCHNFGFIALMNDHGIVIGGLNRFHEGMCVAQDNYDIQYIDNLPYIPKRIFATGFTTIIQTTKGNYIRYGNGMENNGKLSGEFGKKFEIEEPLFVSEFKNTTIENMYLKSGLLISVREKPSDLYCLFNLVGHFEGIIDLKQWFSDRAITQRRIKGACSDCVVVIYEATFPEIIYFTKAHVENVE